MAKINKRILKQYDEGRVTSISDEEMEHLVRRYMPEVFPSEFDLLKRSAYDMAAHLIERYIEEEGVKSMIPEQQEEVLKGLVTEYPYIQFAYVVNAEGLKITRNITQIVDRAKYAKIDLHEDFSDRDWFIEPMKTGRISVTSLYSSRITGSALRSQAPFMMRPATSWRSWASTLNLRTSPRRMNSTEDYYNSIMELPQVFPFVEGEAGYPLAGGRRPGVDERGFCPRSFLFMKGRLRQLCCWRGRREPR